MFLRLAFSLPFLRSRPPPPPPPPREPTPPSTPSPPVRKRLNRSLLIGPVQWDNPEDPRRDWEGEKGEENEAVKGDLRELLWDWTSDEPLEESFFNYDLKQLTEHAEKFRTDFHFTMGFLRAGIIEYQEHVQDMCVLHYKVVELQEYRDKYLEKEQEDKETEKRFIELMEEFDDWKVEMVRAYRRRRRQLMTGGWEFECRFDQVEAEMRKKIEHKVGYVRTRPIPIPGAELPETPEEDKEDDCDTFTWLKMIRRNI